MLGKCLVGFCFMLYTGKKRIALWCKPPAWLQHQLFCRCLYSCRNCTVGQWSALHISKRNGYIPRPGGRRLSTSPATDKFSKWITHRHCIGYEFCTYLQVWGGGRCNVNLWLIFSGVTISYDGPSDANNVSSSSIFISSSKCQVAYLHSFCWKSLPSFLVNNCIGFGFSNFVD